MTDVFAAAVARALNGMKDYPPEPLLDEVNHHLRRDGRRLDESDLLELLTPEDPNDEVRRVFHIQLSRWDRADGESWTSDGDGRPTVPGSTERRALVLGQLGLGTSSVERIAEVFPLREDGAVVISDSPADWDPWYTDERAAKHRFYWDAYRGVLASKMDAYAVAEIDLATDEIVRRLADPTRRQPYQARGLVVGHVQSGKTANFTGVVAKAVDAGYRLVIVLTGTIEILRSQTQRRIDMELVGAENILGGIDPAATDLLAAVDYAGVGDRDWVEGRFLKHGVNPKDVGEPEIHRLSSSRWDYKKLLAGLTTLDFRTGNELVDRAKPLYDPVNLFGADVRIAVVKKNSAVLGRLVDDLRRIRTDLGEIPTLIIDDEADQASVNTVNPRRSSAEHTERSAINRRISELLGLLKRAQYVGYTATPFANVFVDPDDSADIFPKDFIISLEPPAAYMGGRDFHDLDLAEDDERNIATSNEKAFVRDLWAEPADTTARDAEITRALDTFVLTGAIKLWRESVQNRPGRFRHHTMLVHESVKQFDHDALAAVVHDLWRRAGYSTPHGMRRLHDLWHDDLLPVSQVRAEGEPVPTDFHALRPHIGAAIDRISRGSSPVVVVNGAKDSDYAQADLDFQTGDVWKILVGGAKLSRGFTVEGLTVSYYTRRTTAADTLMQMGRWFGYRAGYKDLVRLFVGRDVPAPRGGRVDLYATFEAIVRDEEDFRAELRTFQGVDEHGQPRVRPSEVPPMVYQSLPWLKPTSTNKMYNAELTLKGEGGTVKDFNRQPERSGEVNRRHFAAVAPLLDVATMTGVFFSDSGSPYPAQYGILPAQQMIQVLHRFVWADKYDFGPILAFHEQAVAEGNLTEWVVLVPTLTGKDIAQRRIGGRSEELSVLTRTRRDRGGFSGSSPRQRRAMEIISGGVGTGEDASEDLRRAAQLYPDASLLHSPTRGALLLSFSADSADGRRPLDLPDPVQPADIATLFSLAFPKRAAPVGRVGFSVRVPGAGPIIDRTDALPD